jgi:Holliday junction resolvasome RuvABC endonuclease subunit
VIPIVIGLDLSLTKTGIASSRGWTDLIRYPGKLRGHDRLRWICATVAEHVIDDVALVVVEGPSYGSQAGQAGHHERAGLWWMVTHGLWRRGIHYAVASPASRAKYATGRGNAAKADVVREVARRFDWFAGGEDEADALVLAAVGADWLGHPMATLPELHRKALVSVKWPAALNVPDDVLSASHSDQNPLPRGLGYPSHAEEPSARIPGHDTYPLIG